MNVWRTALGGLLGGLMAMGGLCGPAGGGQAARGDTGPPSPDAAPVPSAEADWVSTDGRCFLDAAGRQVILRGFVTITHNSDSSGVDYTLEDYQRMVGMGANYQSIRIFLGILEGRGGESRRAAYLAKLDSMVRLAQKARIRSEFKMTVYDIRPFGEEQWKAFWENEGGRQEDLVRAWRLVWDRFKDEPAVVGYDLLNEARTGGLGRDAQDFVARYQVPLYRKVIDALRETDARHLTFFQPALGDFDRLTGTVSYPPFRVSLDRRGTVYAPHFYTSILGRDTTLYGPLMRRYAQEAALTGSPLFIGEYGVPWDRHSDGQAQEEARYRRTEQAAADLFDEQKVGFSRPWYADDRARAGERLNWAVIKGTDGLGGEDRRIITDVIARPYPQRTAGKLVSFRFDPSPRRFQMRYVPDASKGRTEIFIPAARHFAGGFQVRYGSDAALVWTPPAGLNVVERAAGVPPEAFRWAAAWQCLGIGEWLKDKEVAIEVFPLDRAEGGAAPPPAPGPAPR